jgi:hypothetical protein
MPTTKLKIAEQVSRIYTRYIDRENIRPIANKEEMKLLVEQSINEILKSQIMPAGKMGGVDIPESCVIYLQDQTVATDDQGAYVTLTITPLNLPNDMGIREVYPSGGFNDDYIPLPRNMVRNIKGTILDALEQQVGWFRHGNKIRFTKDITTATWGTVNAVDISLLVMDFASYTDNEPLPIPPEIEGSVIVRTLDILSKGRFSQTELAAMNENFKVQS